MNYIVRFDNWVFRGINGRLRCRVLDKLMPGMTFLGGATASVVTCILLMVISYKINGLGKSSLYALAGSHLVVQIMKRFVTRPRPYLALDEVNIWEKFILKDYSFPSGHTTASFSLATVISVYFPAVAPFVLILALLVGLSRIYLGQHYPSDVFIGSLIGIVSGIIAVTVR